MIYQAEIFKRWPMKIYWLLMQVCQSNIFFSLLYSDYHPIFIVLWPFIALAKDALRQVR
jgi:hypothetical protein